MKESEFIEQNKEKWLDFENNLLKNDADPSKTARLFVQVTDDLSYARTFYPNRSVKLYLNGIAKLLFNDLNRSGKKGLAGFIKFWKTDLPLTVYRSRRSMLISLCVFIACFILGVVTSMQDKNFARTILSSDYVDMTNNNIAKGDAMAVYKSEGELETFLPIFYNNLKVDFLTFFSGIFMAIGSLVVMIINGVMVGVFQYFFIERGLFWPSFLTIWTHGALEISAIVLSGGAGLTLGKGLLFPGTHSRFHAFKLSGMDGLKIIMGVAPVTLLAAFIEGFLTRHTNIPDLIRFTFILLSFAFIILYFFLYPKRVARHSSHEPVNPGHTLVYTQEAEFNPAEIYTGVKIVTETFRLLFKNFVFFGRLMFLPAFVCSVLVAWNPVDLFHARDDFNFTSDNFFNYEEYPFLGLLTLVTFAGIATAAFLFLRSKLVPVASEKINPLSASLVKTGTAVLITLALFVLIIFTGIDFTLLFAQILFPFFVFFACCATYHGSSVYESVGYSGSLLAQSWSRFLATAFVFMFVSFITYLTTIYGLKLLFIKDALVWMLTDDDLVSQKITMGLMVFQTFISFFLYLLLSVISNSLLFFTLNEIYTAGHLISKIKAITVNR